MDNLQSYKAFQDLMERYLNARREKKEAIATLQSHIQECQCLQETTSIILGEKKNSEFNKDSNDVQKYFSKISEEKENIDSQLISFTQLLKEKQESVQNLKEQLRMSNDAAESLTSKRCLSKAFLESFGIVCMSPLDEKLLEGHIFFRHSKKTVPFKFDTGKTSQYFITKFLWEKMEEDFLT